MRKKYISIQIENSEGDAMRNTECSCFTDNVYPEVKKNCNAIT